MKKILLLLAAVAISAGVYAQKTGFVNTETIFKSIPEYNSVLEQVEALAKARQDAIAADFDKIAEMYDRYQLQKASLSEASRKQVEDNIIKLEEQALEQQQQAFGNDGEVMKKRVELIKPIQDRVFEAIDKILAARKLELVIDISNNPSIVSYDKNLDLTQEVLKSLGVNK